MRTHLKLDFNTKILYTTWWCVFGRNERIICTVC
jgi:hypothetical protein